MMDVDVGDGQTPRLWREKWGRAAEVLKVLKVMGEKCQTWENTSKMDFVALES
jgi:hypothetical protein